jgi:hypothetical protein
VDEVVMGEEQGSAIEQFRQFVAGFGVHSPKASLRSNGKLAGVARPPSGESYVYVVELVDREVPRVSGASSAVLYVGMGVGGRLASLERGGHSSRRALAGLHRVLTGSKQAELPVRVRVEKAAHPEFLECHVLWKYVQAFGELPPANAHWEGWLPQRFLGKLARHAVKQRRPQKWYAEGPFEYPEGDDPTATWFNLWSEGRKWELSIGWTYGHDDDRVAKDWSGALGVEGRTGWGQVVFVAPAGERRDKLTTALGDGWGHCEVVGSLDARLLDPDGSEPWDSDKIGSHYRSAQEELDRVLTKCFPP